MKTAAVKDTHGKKEGERCDRQIIKECHKIEDSVGEALESIEKRERFYYQARILQLVVIPFSRGSSQPRNRT